MRFIRRLAYWLRLRSHHADLMTEVAFHRDMLEQELVRRGMPPDAARAQARRTMGNATVMREASRAVWLWPSLEAVWQDATYTIRDLRRNPTFTVGVTLTLALGIGANAAMFSLIDRLLFRPPAFMIDPATVQHVYMYRTGDARPERSDRECRILRLLRRTTGARPLFHGERRCATESGAGRGVEPRTLDDAVRRAP